MIGKLTRFRQQHPLLHATMRGVLGFVVSEGLGRLGDTVGMSLRHGRAEDPRFKRFVCNHPILTMIHGSFLAPIAEEAVYRRLPSYLLDKNGRSGLQTSAAIGISLVFAAGHCGPYGIPVPQFLGGLNYWEIQRVDGYRYAVIAHSVRNTLGAMYHFYKWRVAD